MTKDRLHLPVCIRVFISRPGRWQDNYRLAKLANGLSHVRRTTSRGPCTVDRWTSEASIVTGERGESSVKTAHTSPSIPRLGTKVICLACLGVTVQPSLDHIVIKAPQASIHSRSQYSRSA